MTIDVEEFRKYLIIDKNSLDEVVSQHPELMDQVGEAYIEAAAERDIFKELLATIDAQLDAVVREELEGEKVTESIVKNRVQVHKDHKAAFEAYIQAKALADRLGILKEAFHARTYMIRELAGLFVFNYYITSSVQVTPTQRDAIYKRQRQRLAEARERRE